MVQDAQVPVKKSLSKSVFPKSSSHLVKQQKTDHPHRMSSLFATFLHYLTHTKNSSQKTVRNYSLWIGRIIDYLGNPMIEELKPIDILNFRMFLDELGLSPKTINYHIIAMRSFLKFLHKNEVACLSAEKLELSKIPQREVVYLQEDEIEDILSAPYRYEKHPLKQARDVLILHILYGTGLRVSELISLRRDSINFGQKQFSIRGKGSKLRSVFFTSTALELLEQYLDLREDSYEAVFISLSRNSY